MTARDLITSTLRSIRVLGMGDVLLAEDANDGLDRLNDWIDSLALERLTIPFVARTVKLLANDTASYTVGLGGDIHIIRPTHIEAAGLILDTAAVPPYERPLEVWTDQRWQLCRQKTLASSYPEAVHYDHNWVDPTSSGNGLATLYVWPIPRDCAGTALILYSPVALREFATLDTDYTFPPGYRRFLRTNFAREVAPEYGKQLTADQNFTATQAKAQIKRGNVRPAEARVDSALIRAGNYFDWRTGEPR
jgi:hypothetical protein